MPSKQVTDRVKSSKSVQAAIAVHADPIAEKMKQDFGVALADSCRTLLVGLGHKLEGATAAMVAADDANLAELGDGAPLRLARDHAAEELRAVLVDVRQYATFVFGPTAAGSLGFHGETPADPEALLGSAQFVLDHLPDWKAPPSRYPAAHFDKHAWLDKLRAPTGALREAIAAVAKEDRQTQATVVAKHKAMADYDRVFSLVANLTSALLAAAGERELADHLRPSTRKPGQTMADAAAPDAPAPTSEGAQG